MSKQKGFWIETGRCIDCWACEVACKQWHGIKAGTYKRRRVIDIVSGTFPDVKRTFVSISCMHCSDPPCAAVCPVGAISKRIEDGIVVVDQDKCIGCRSCFSACPFGVPAYTADGYMDKCDMCLSQNLKEGEQPRCVATCPVQALHAGTVEELSALAAERADRNSGATLPSVIFSF